MVNLRYFEWKATQDKSETNTRQEKLKGLKWLWVLSSAGRASPLQGESRRFDPVSTHHSIFFIEQSIDYFTYL